MLLLLQSARIFQPDVIRRRPVYKKEVDDEEDLLLLFFMLMTLTPREDQT